MIWLLTADWHLRNDRPVCRTDADWIGHQRACIREVFDLALARRARVRIVGDIFHIPRPATEVVCMVVEEFSRFLAAGGEVDILAGNHDLPYHNYDLAHQCAFGVLRGMVPEIQSDDTVNAAPFGRDESTADEFTFTHRLVFPDSASIPPGCDFAIAEEVMEKFPSRVVFTGDYHHAFLHRAQGDWRGHPRFLVNPGCLNRQVVDMASYRPRVCLFDTNATGLDAFEWVYLQADTDESLVTREHIQLQEERDARIEAFVQQIASSKGLSLSFMDNLEAQAARAPAGVHAITHEIIQKAKDNA